MRFQCQPIPQSKHGNVIQKDPSIYNYENIQIHKNSHKGNRNAHTKMRRKLAPKQEKKPTPKHEILIFIIQRYSIENINIQRKLGLISSSYIILLGVCIMIVLYKCYYNNFYIILLGVCTMINYVTFFLPICVPHMGNLQCMCVHVAYMSTYSYKI